MKRYLIVLLLMCGISIQAQDLIQCRKIVQEAINAIDVKSSKNLEPFLDDDFSIFEQTGDKAKMVLQQFMVKINDVVAEYHEIQTEPSSGYLTLKYIFTYKNRGTKESTFVFSPQNKLVKISLFEIKPLTEAYADQIFQSNEDTIRIPFTLNTGNLIIVDAMLNGQVRKFFFDSGSPKLILNAEYIDQDDVNEENSMLKARGVNTGIRNISLVKDQNFNWAGIQLDNQTLMATNLSTLEKGCKNEIYGIIGYEIFRNYDIHFDYQKKVLTLIRAGYLDQYALKHKFSGRKHTVIPFQLATHIPVVKAVVNDRELNMGIDCGAGIDLLSLRAYQEFGNQIRKKKSDTLTGVDNQPTLVKTGLLRKMTIGGRKFKNPKVIANDMTQINQSTQLSMDGLIGYEILKRQESILSYSKKELIFINFLYSNSD